MGEILVSDDEKIIKALSDKSWDYRTAEGIAKETGLPIERVLTFLASRQDVVLKASLPDRFGRTLYTLNDGRGQANNVWRSFATFMTKVSS
jgi:hypothetical protein